MRILLDEFIMRNALLILNGLLALGLIASVCLFLNSQREIQKLARRQKQAIADLAGRMESTAVVLQTTSELEADGGITFAASTSGARPALNLSKRVQALRLLRRGQDVGHVSAVLGMTRREIELLIRVQELASARSAGRTL